MAHEIVTSTRPVKSPPSGLNVGVATCSSGSRHPNTHKNASSTNRQVLTTKSASRRNEYDPASLSEHLFRMTILRHDAAPALRLADSNQNACGAGMLPLRAHSRNRNPASPSGPVSLLARRWWARCAAGRYGKRPASDSSPGYSPGAGLLSAPPTACGSGPGRRGPAAPPCKVRGCEQSTPHCSRWD